MVGQAVAERIEGMKKTFREKFGNDPTVIVRAPGRVNLIGEHTDYNEGFVFPIAIDREMLIAARPSSGDQVRIYSLDYKEDDAVDLTTIEQSTKQWSNYLRGVLHVMQEAGHKIVPFDAVLEGNIPQGAGLSSSAAYEVAVATLVNSIGELGLTAKQIAQLAQKAENEFIGVQCGIMDQFIAALGQPDSALFIDCGSLEYSPVRLNLDKANASIVITNSGVVRGLVDSDYNGRRFECEQGVQLIGQLLQKELTSLRQVSSTELNRVYDQLPEEVARRCSHVISENERVLEARDVLEKGDMDTLGRLMNESHASLRDDFQVSCAELDRLVELTQAHPGTIGARMTGAGFGGCMVALMRTDAIQTFIAQIVPRYEYESQRKAEVYICSAVAGAEILPAALPV